MPPSMRSSSPSPPRSRVKPPLELEALSDDKLIVDSPSTLVLCFILAVVVGYFAGRTLSIRNRMSSDRD
jgi:hypothetical protein